MSENERKKLKPLDITHPRGVTVGPRKAAELLNVSLSEFNRRAPEWGLTTYWDTGGRRYTLTDLEAAKMGLLEPVEPPTVDLDFELMKQYDIPEGSGFRVHGKGVRRARYLGHYSGPDPYAVKEWLKERYGGGKYALRLIDSEGRLTKYKFVLTIGGPSRIDDEEDVYREERTGEFSRETPVEAGTLRRRVIDRVKVALQYLH